MWIALFKRFLRRLIREGHLAVSVGAQSETVFGNGTGEKVTVHIKDTATVRRLILDTELAVGESYMDGSVSIDGDDVQGLLGIVVRNYAQTGHLPAVPPGLRFTTSVQARPVGTFSMSSALAVSRS